MPETTIITADSDTLRTLIEEAVDSRLRERLPEALKEAQRPEWADAEYVKRRYGYTRRQLTYLRSEGRIEYSKRGRTIRYHIPSLERYLEEGRVRPQSGPLTDDE